MAPFNHSRLPRLPPSGADMNRGLKAINAFQDYIHKCDQLDWLEIERYNRVTLLKDLRAVHADSLTLEGPWATTLTNEIRNAFHLLKNWMPPFDPKKDGKILDELNEMEAQKNRRPASKPMNVIEIGSDAENNDHASGAIYATWQSAPPNTSTQSAANITHQDLSQVHSSRKMLINGPTGASIGRGQTIPAEAISLTASRTNVHQQNTDIYHLRRPQPQGMTGYRSLQDPVIRITRTLMSDDESDSLKESYGKATSHLTTSQTTVKPRTPLPSHAPIVYDLPAKAMTSRKRKGDDIDESLSTRKRGSIKPTAPAAPRYE